MLLQVQLLWLNVFPLGVDGDLQLKESSKGELQKVPVVNIPSICTFTRSPRGWVLVIVVSSIPSGLLAMFPLIAKLILRVEYTGHGVKLHAGVYSAEAL